jgi:hypothetical protein
MKAYLFGLIGLVAMAGGVALGQAPPMALPAGPGGAPVIVPAPTLPTSCPQGGCCAHDCMPTKTVCVPEQYMKKTPKTCYSCDCAPHCIDYPFGLFKKCSCCGDNNPTPRKKKWLIKKVHIQECPATRCVPACVPACDHACPAACPAGGCCQK